MASVSEHHSLGSVAHRLGEIRVVARAVFAAHAVALNIRLVHHIEAELIAHIIELFAVGVVAGAYGVDVCLFHQVKILLISEIGHGPAVIGVKIVTVNALDDDLLPVDVEHIAFDLGFAEADFYCLGGEYLSALLEHDDELIEVGRLRAPGESVLLDIFIVKHGFAALCD